MTVSFLILAAVAIAGTAAAVCLRQPIHCILALTVALVGLAAIYLQLDAQFVGFTQVIVYVGAVAILAVFAMMMTRGAHAKLEPQFSSHWVAGSAIAVAVFAVLAWAIGTGAAASAPAPQPQVSVQQIGDALMRQFALPLEIVGSLLTAALIGAVILAMPEKPAAPDEIAEEKATP